MGMQQVAWAVESQMNMLGEKLGVDPVEFRLKNAFEEELIRPPGGPRQRQR